MARSDWTYLNLDKPLMEEVDKVVESVLIHGSRKYVDRKDFVIKAIQSQLQKEMPEVRAK
jgi:metal-responsive CopG/Arc/MetJ family transcriptional regulator